MNGTLKLNSEWQEARAVVEAAGLPSYILANASLALPVLDVGGLPDYVINPAFSSDWTDAGGKIRYLRGDATRSADSDQHFGAVTCLSVTEHGVPLEAFFREMHPVLISGGHLIVSTDFWHEPIDAGDRHAFGVIDFRCVESTEWLALDYTFIDFGLKKLD